MDAVESMPDTCLETNIRAVDVVVFRLTEKILAREIGQKLGSSCNTGDVWQLFTSENTYGL